MGSTRLPGKILKTIHGRTLLRIHVERILKSRKIDKLVIATTTDMADDLTEAEALRMQIDFYRGSVENVLDRFYQAAKKYEPQWVVRLTADCPLLDSVLLDAIVAMAIEKDVDYCSNTLAPSFPDGMDVEVFKYSALQRAWKEAKLYSEKEHVTPYIHRNSSFNRKDLFTSCNFDSGVDYGNVRLTVDGQSDLEVITRLIEKLGIDKDWKSYADYYLSDKEISAMNASVKRNEGYTDSVSKD